MLLSLCFSPTATLPAVTVTCFFFLSYTGFHNFLYFDPLDPKDCFPVRIPVYKFISLLFGSFLLMFSFHKFSYHLFFHMQFRSIKRYKHSVIMFGRMKMRKWDVTLGNDNKCWNKLYSKSENKVLIKTKIIKLFLSYCLFLLWSVTSPETSQLPHLAWCQL